MSSIYQSLWLLAVKREGMGAGFRGENNHYDLTQMGIVIALLALIIAILYLIDRGIRHYNRTKMYNSPWELFRQLCRTHELARQECQQLKQLATHWRLAHPAVLFIEPEYYRADKLPSDWLERVPHIEHLHRKLFDAL
jgi:hypothetical protein